MATIVLGVVGAVAGTFIDNPYLGFQIGASIGAVIDTYVAGALQRAWAKRPQPPEMVRNPTGDAGTGVVWCSGQTIRVPGQIIYMSDLRRQEIVNGGDRKGKQPGTSTYKYRCDVAIAWCRNEIDHVKKIYAGGEPIYFDGGTVIQITAAEIRYIIWTEYEHFDDGLSTVCDRPSVTYTRYEFRISESSPDVPLYAFFQDGHDITFAPGMPGEVTYRLWIHTPMAEDVSDPGYLHFAIVIATWYIYDPSNPCAPTNGSPPGDADVIVNPENVFVLQQTLDGVSPFFDDIACYPGDYTQDRDPTLVAALGGSIPAFRGTAYCVLQNFDITKWAGMLPQYEAVVVESSTRTVADTILQLLARADAPDTAIEVDVESLRSPEIAMRGVYTAGPVPPAEILQQIIALYDIQVQMRFERTFSWSRVPQPILRFFKRADADVIALPETQATAKFSGDEDGSRLITITRNSRYDIPQEFVLDYISSDFDYQPQTTSYAVTNGAIRNQIKMSTPLVLTAQEADELCRRMFWIGVRQQNIVKFSTTQQWLHIMPGDRIDIARIESLPNLRVYVSQVDVSVSGLLEVEAKVDDIQIYRQYYGGDAPLPVSGAVFDTPASATPVVLDIPPIFSNQDRIFGLWFGFQSPGTSTANTAQFFISKDNVNWSFATSSNAVAVVGTCRTTLPSRDHWFWDTESSLDVKIQVGSVTSSTRELVADGYNWAWVGGEVIGFVDVEIRPDNVYRLTTLLRGRLDTYERVGAHVSGERFVLLPPLGSGVKFNSIDDHLYKVNIYVKAILSGQSPSDAAIAYTTITPRAETLAWWRPHACWALRSLNYDICLYAHARVRSPERLFGAATPEWSEDVTFLPEKWLADVYLFSGSTPVGPVRTLCGCETEWGSIAWEYTREKMIYDAVTRGLSGYPAAKVRFTIYHERGSRGEPNTRTVDVLNTGATIYTTG